MCSASNRKHGTPLVFRRHCVPTFSQLCSAAGSRVVIGFQRFRNTKNTKNTGFFEGGGVVLPLHPDRGQPTALEDHALRWASPAGVTQRTASLSIGC
jgi:hypothetical protein